MIYGFIVDFFTIVHFWQIHEFLSIRYLEYIGLMKMYDLRRINEHILIVNGAKHFAHSNGELNDTLTELANAVLGELGHSTLKFPVCR